MPLKERVIAEQLVKRLAELEEIVTYGKAYMVLAHRKSNSTSCWTGYRPETVEEVEEQLGEGCEPAGHFVVMLERRYERHTGGLTGEMATEIRIFPCEGSTALVWHNGYYLMRCAKTTVEHDWPMSDLASPTHLKQ